MLSSISFLKRPAIFLLGLLLGGGLSAQPERLRSQPPWTLELELGTSFGAELSDGTATRDEIDVLHAGVKVAHRLPVTADGTRVTLELEYDRYQLANESGTAALPERALALALQATVRRPLNDRWLLLGSLKPTLANAGSGFDGDGLGVTVGAFGLYRQSASLTWGVGLLYRSLAEDDLRLLPALGVEWRPAPQWRVDVGFPRTALTYSTSERWRWSFSAAGHGGTFHVDTVDGAPTPLRDTLLDYTEIRVGLGFEFEPSAGLILSMTAGMIAHQEFDYFERNYEIEAGNNPGFVRAGVSWRY